MPVWYLNQPQSESLLTKNDRVAVTRQMTNPSITGRQCVGKCLLGFLALLTILVIPATSHAQSDSVIIVGGRYSPGETFVNIGIRLINSVELSEVSVPLQLRSVTPGAFVTSLNMTYSARLGDPSTLPDVYRTDQFDAPAGGAPCSYLLPTHTDGATHPVTASPEGVWFQRAGNEIADWLEIGSDPEAVPSMYIGVDLTATSGIFEIDTMCIDPGGPSNFLRFADGTGADVPVVFVKGIVTINSPPIARDTTINMFVDGFLAGAFPASDPDGDPLVYNVLSLPPIGDLDFGPDGAFEFGAPNDAGSTSFDFEVSDGLSTDIGTITIVFDYEPPEILYVRKTGIDAPGNGTPTNPFRTIPYAISAASHGDRIVVGPGSYDQPGEVPVVFPQNHKLTIVSESGPFQTELVGTPSASGSVVVMHAPAPGDTLTISGFTIRDNHVDDPGCDFCGGGITVGNSTVAVIQNCIIRNNSASGTSGRSVGGILFSGSGGVVANNWITRNAGLLDPTDVGGMIVATGADIAVLNNTITQNSSPDASATAGVNVEDETSLSQFDNNIVAFNFPGVGLRAGSILTGTESTVNNLYFGNDGDAEGFPTTTGWLFEEPLLADTGSGDLHLTCESPARNGGQIAVLPSGVSFDIDGQLRVPSNPPPRVDIGADQFYDENKQAQFSATPDFGCAPLNVSFTNLSTCIDEEWRWSFGDGGTSISKNPFHLYTQPGVYEVRLIALGTVDADTTFDTIRVIGDLDVNFTSNVQTGCIPFAVDFTAFADDDADMFIWDFGDGDIDTGQQVTHTYTSAALRTVTVEAVNLCGTYSHTKTDYIDAKTLPVVQMTSVFDTMVTVPCNPFAVQFGYTSDRPIVAWSWDFGDNSTSTDSTPVHVFAAGDTFSVRLIATGECGNSQHVRTNYIKLKPRPIVAAQATPSFACVGETQVSLSATVTGSVSSSLWLFGDGATAPGLTVNHTYTQVGRYLPKIVVVSSCGQDTIAVADSITIGSLPGAALSVNVDSGYEQLSAQFTDQSSNLPTSWVWRFGDNQTSLLQNPSHTYAVGLHQASLIASNPCGADTSSNRRIVVGSYRSVIVDSLGISGDTILYSVRVDTLVVGYDHTVYLKGDFTPLPSQGNIEFRFEPSSGTPPFTSTMKVVPSLNLASGNYSLEMRAVDSLRLNQQGQPLTKLATRSYAHQGFTAISVTPNPIPMDSAIVSQLISRTVTIRNTSTQAEPYTLIVQPAQISGPPFEILPNQGNGATLSPGQSITWSVGFEPTRKGDVTGWVRVRSNDPGHPNMQVTITGRGIGEQVPPRVSAAVPAQNAELMIDQGVHLTFNELIVNVSLDTILQVTSRRAGASVPGLADLNPLTMSFTPTEWFWPDDTVTVRLRSFLTDTNGNRLDGNSDGTETGSPSDDYVLTFFTGPGVYPGDANRDGIVNEADILPIGRFWRLQGPPRLQAYTDLSMQPSRAFPVRVAAHADCDGNGIVDSADICPIAEFFDQDTVLPKATVEMWLAEAQAWNTTVVDAMLGALIDCPSQGTGTAVLRQALTEMQSQSPIPHEYALDQNYPNPFNPATVIAFSLSAIAEVQLDVFDILGRRVTTLADGELEAGVHRVIWDGRDEEGAAVASGIYFYRLRSDKFTQTRKMLLLK